MFLNVASQYVQKFTLYFRHFGYLEDALWLWGANKRVQNVALSDEIVRSKAKYFGKELGITEYSYSNGWLHRFNYYQIPKLALYRGSTAYTKVNLTS